MVHTEAVPLTRPGIGWTVGERMTKIAPIFQDAAFGPEVTRAMAAAFDKACQSIKAHPQEIPFERRIARTIIELARQGEHYPVRLCGLALKAELNIDP
jgi:hypothetical protein